MISTPLRMEKPVRSPIVPPMRPRAASVVTLRLTHSIVRSWKFDLQLNLYIPVILIIGFGGKVDVDILKRHSIFWKCFIFIPCVKMIRFTVKTLLLTTDCRNNSMKRKRRPSDSTTTFLEDNRTKASKSSHLSGWLALRCSSSFVCQPHPKPLPSSHLGFSFRRRAAVEPGWMRSVGCTAPQRQTVNSKTVPLPWVSPALWAGRSRMRRGWFGSTLVTTRGVMKAEGDRRCGQERPGSGLT